MARPVLYGADYSVYVRIARLALSEKGIDHDLVPVDVFADDGPPAWYVDLHPFGRIPALEHGGLRLFETGAITRYADEAFDGPALQPVGPVERARMNQIIGILDAYAYRTLVWDIYVERVSKPKRGERSDERRIASALDKATTCLQALAGLQGDARWLVGDRLTLADLHAAPIFAYFVQAPEAAALLAPHPRLGSWLQAVSARQSFIATEPTT